MSTLWINGRFIDRPVTGVERVAREVIRALKAHCLDADGFLPTNGGRLRVKLIAPRNTAGEREYLGIEVVRAGRTRGHLWEQLELPLLTRGDALLSLCNTGPLWKREHWIFLHDAQPFAIPGNFRRPVRLWYQFLYRQCGRRARSVLVNSHFTAHELERLAGIAADRMRVCPLGADHAWDVVPEPVEGLPDEPYLVAFASGNPNKNFAAVCAALDVLGDDAPVCLVVGEASPRVFASTFPSSSKVRQLGRLSDGQLATLLEGAHALVFPSFYEGFGLPPLEAMTRSCPVIVANAGALPELATGAALFCDPHRPETLAAAIARLLASPELSDWLKRSGHARAQGYTWRRCATEVTGALQTITGGQASPDSDLLLDP